MIVGSGGSPWAGEGVEKAGLSYLKRGKSEGDRKRGEKKIGGWKNLLS